MRLSIKINCVRSEKLAKKIFIDTNPLIYLVGKQEPYYEKVISYIAKGILEKAEFYTSTITDAEFLLKPYLTNDFDKIELFKSCLKQMNFLKCFINEEIAENAAKLRAKYTGLKLADALQLSASIACECDEFFTNDKRLRQVLEARVVYLGDWEK